MKKVSYKTQVIALVVWIMVVFGLFRLVPDKQMAGFIAGLGFLILPLFLLVAEFKGEKNNLHRAAIITFLVCTALPIFIVRIATWGEDFNTTDFFGVPSPFLHKLANFLYVGVLASAIYQWSRTPVPAK